MNWDDLRFFLALAREGTASQAGRILKVRHTTVSRRIKALEQRLGTRLFDHLRDGYHMTQAGERLYRHAATMEQQAHAVDREVFGLDAQLQGQLTLTAAHDVFSRLVVPRLDAFREAYPGIDLELLSESGLTDLGARQADIALRLTPKPPDYLVGKRSLTLGIGLYASREYLERHPRPRDLVLWNDEIDRPQWALRHFADAKVAIRANDVTTLLACVERGMGVTMLPCYIGDYDRSHLCRLDLPLEPSSWGVWVLSHVDLRTTARVRACREFLLEIIEAQSRLIGGLDSNYWSVSASKSNKNT